MFAVIWFCSTKFVRETLCKFMHIYAKKNVYLYNIMINRKIWGIFGVSLAPLRKRPIFLLSVFSIFRYVLIFLAQTETEAKNPLFWRFCLKTSVFVANKTLIFSDLRLYRANHTPHPHFWHSKGCSALFRKFFIFLFFIFCKILWFCQFRFSTEFWAFLIISYLLFFLHKVS